MKNGQYKWKYDYSGSDYKNWIPRTRDEVIELGKRYLECENPTQRTNFVSEHCVRYSVFSKLPYFCPVTQNVIDPLHNLWLGVTKNVIEQWKKSEILTEAKMKKLEKAINSLGASRRYGRLKQNSRR